MSAILEKMAAAHDARKPTAVAVPQYDDTWYFTPMTVQERTRIRKSAGSEDEVLLSIETLIAKAMDADGKPVFEDSPKSRHLIGQMDVAEMQRIMTEAVGETVSEPTKN